MPLTTRPQPPSLRDALAVAELFVGVFRRDLLAFYPHGQFERVESGPLRSSPASGPDFQLIERDDRDDRSVAIRCSGRSIACPRGMGHVSRPTTGG